VTREIMQKAGSITRKYAGTDQLSTPAKLDFVKLKEKTSLAFIALHGRPGEDGAIQEKLEEAGIAYNGSGRESSSLTIDKYRTNELLRANGFLVAGHTLVTEDEWRERRDEVNVRLDTEIGYPFIAKPVDDGCSSAVKKIGDREEFIAYCNLLFRREESFDSASAQKLNIRQNEEVPQKSVILVEELISRKGASRFLEITGGMLSTSGDTYEVFEASEALADEAILSLEEKFLAGQGQNITPARYAEDTAERQRISDVVKQTLGAAAKVLGVSGYCRIDAFVRIYSDGRIEVIFIEVNSLPGMTPATCIFHQAAIDGYKPFDFIDAILEYGRVHQKAVT
jgi:UDP-N-acetylmuramate--alanine ligase